MGDPRYLIIVLGQYKNIEEDLTYVANPEYGVHYVNGTGIFMGTFYSPYTVDELHDVLSHISALLLFDISDDKTHVVNLPSYYFKGLFPEYDELLNSMTNGFSQLDEDVEELESTDRTEVEEYDKIDDILDKLIRNKYNRECLTDRELKILENSGN
jgi:hypothetical protein